MFKKFLGHVIGHADTTMGGGVAGEESGVHAHSAIEAEEVRHGGALIHLSGARFVDAGIGVVVHNLPRRHVPDDAVEGGAMVDALLLNFEGAWEGLALWRSGRDRGDSDEMIVFVEIGLLVRAADSDRGRPRDAVPVPETFVIKGIGRAGGEGLR